MRENAAMVMCPDRLVASFPDDAVEDVGFEMLEAWVIVRLGNTLVRGAGYS